MHSQLIAFNYHANFQQKGQRKMTELLQDAAKKIAKCTAAGPTVVFTVYGETDRTKNPEEISASRTHSAATEN